MKAKLQFKSLAEVPANVLAVAASLPAKAVKLSIKAASASKQMFTVPVTVTRQEFALARERSRRIADDFQMRSTAPLKSSLPWPRGGLNE